MFAAEEVLGTQSVSELPAEQEMVVTQRVVYISEPRDTRPYLSGKETGGSS